MSKKQVNGQLSLFDYINSIEEPGQMGSMEMVSLMPEPEEESEQIQEPKQIQEIEKEPEVEPKVEPEVEPEIKPESETELELVTVQNPDDDIDTGSSQKSEAEESILQENPQEIPQENPHELPRKLPSVDFKSAEEEPPVMSKYFKTSDGQDAYVEYRNYNRVLIQHPGRELVEEHFNNSMDAVDFYIKEMLAMSDDKSLKVLE